VKKKNRIRGMLGKDGVATPNTEQGEQSQVVLKSFTTISKNCRGGSPTLEKSRGKGGFRASRSGEVSGELKSQWAQGKGIRRKGFPTEFGGGGEKGAKRVAVR